MTEALSKLNFRDIGGLLAAGGVVRHGILYRSEGPASFAPAHRDELAAMGIRLVCDLRAGSERDKDPNDWTTTARLMNLDITADLRVATNEGWKTLQHDPTLAAARAALMVNYGSMPAAIRPHLKPLIEAIVAGETPVLIHCTAGKDRTGVLVALLLTALGVPHDVVVADYRRSDVFGKNLRLRGGIHEQFEETFGFRPGEALIDAMVGVDVDFLDAALAAAARDHGDIAGYFVAAGVDGPLFDRFRTTMVAEAG
ncbi:tyrosine-protein phosphatase [Sphingomonas solaris]|uniref:Tyrosine-protein phosphatase n=1 Tax=Alterirhizorhabdus solaris TaxID=2529389 RepID=A0A558RCU3_9SPHN|nr:tyrosine-protein phosphatase [Sphingomonas solaris]TVV77153.1 tyrosine-protein phosphatase [Sphingomonas solaris]